MRPISEVVQEIIMGMSGMPPFSQGLPSSTPDTNPIQAPYKIKSWNPYTPVSDTWPNASFGNGPGSITISLALEKVRAQMNQLVDKLPLTLARKILTLTFQDDAACFVLIFKTGKRLTFTDIDQFPSDEHIARIALECP